MVRQKKAYLFECDQYTCKSSHVILVDWHKAKVKARAIQMAEEAGWHYKTKEGLMCPQCWDLKMGMPAIQKSA